MKALDLHNVQIPSQHELLCLVLSGGLDRAFSEATQQFIQQVFPDTLSLRLYHRRVHTVRCEYILRIAGHEPVYVDGSVSVSPLRARGATVTGALKGQPKTILSKQLAAWVRAWGSAYWLTHIDVQTDEAAYLGGQPYTFSVRFVRR